MRFYSSLYINSNSLHIYFYNNINLYIDIRINYKYNIYIKINLSQITSGQFPKIIMTYKMDIILRFMILQNLFLEA